jgi:hypothetical protein
LELESKERWGEHLLATFVIFIVVVVGGNAQKEKKEKRKEEGKKGKKKKKVNGGWHEFKSPSPFLVLNNLSSLTSLGPLGGSQG